MKIFDDRMNNKEAIEILKVYKQKLEYSCSNQLDKDIEAFSLAIKALERPRGKWEEPFEHKGKMYHECTHCHISTQLILVDNFCPYCGADMRGNT